jgi:rubrerythrin
MRDPAELAGVTRATYPYTFLTMSEEQTQQEQALEKSQLSGEECEMCGTEMFGLHCKLVCPNCGYRRDCSDP